MMDNASRATPARISPQNVAMLCQGSEVYGIGTILKLYAMAFPDMSFIALDDGPLVEWLRDRGCRIDVVPGLARFRASGPSVVTVLKLPRVLLRARRDADRIHQLLKPRGIRIVHAQWRPQQLIAGYLRRHGYLSVWQVNNNMTPGRMLGWGAQFQHWLARWGADLLLPASDFIGANWQGCGVPQRTIRNAAVPTVDQPSVLSMDGSMRCLVVGRLEASKGHHVAVEAVIRARQLGQDVTLDVYGGPLEGNEYAHRLRASVNEAGMAGAVRFMGFCDDLRRRHQEYHLGLQCRIDPEPCSLWVCETLVDGLPLIASATGGTPELVDDGVTGYLYPSGSADALYRRLVELCQDRAGLAQMRRAAFDRGRQFFTLERFARETLEAYASLVPDDGGANDAKDYEARETAHARET
jgi:glycosyltransferase involved in cell wall biosynthesis